MKNIEKLRKAVLLASILVTLIVSASADDFIIRDSQNQPLFVVNGSGEKQILNGNLYLNGNTLSDQDGPVGLSGNTEILNGNLGFSQSVFSITSDGNDVLYYNETDQTRINTPSGLGTDAKFYDSENNQDILRAEEGGDVEIPNGDLNVNGNSIQNVGNLELGWGNLTNYPTGCGTEEAVRVVGDTLDCVSLNPRGTVETGGGSAGEVAFFIDYENITGSDNLYWNNSQTELGIGTSTPTAALDVNGQTNLRNTLSMNGEDIINPGLVDGVDVETPGNAISISDNQYRIASGAIGSTEISSDSITSSGGELASSVAGTQLSLNSGALDVQDTWINEGGDDMKGNLDIQDQYSLRFYDSSGNRDGLMSTDGTDLILKSTSSNNIILQDDSGQAVLEAVDGGKVDVPNGNLAVSGNTDSVDLDNPGNAIIINNSRYAVASGSVESGEIAENAVTNTELENSDEFTVAELTTTGDAQIRGNLDVWGNISNTDVQNLNINGSLYPPSGYSDTFDIGSSTRKWRDIYISRNLEIGSTSLSEANLDALDDGVIQNSELENSDITVNANSGLSGGGTPSLGGTVGVSHTDTSTVSQTNDLSGGTIIQDFSFDGFGHTTSITTKDLDDRYYKESESATNFVNRSGDTMTGSLNLDQNNLYLDESASNPWMITGSNNLAITRSGTGGAEIVYRGSTDTLEVGSNNDGASLKLNGQLNMNSNSITNYFDSDACATGEVVADIFDNGTYNCISITGSAADEFVNEDGDAMTGDLNMQGNDLQNVGTLNASLIQEDGSDIGTLFVDESGDSMSGSLNLQNHHVDNVNYLEMNSEADIRVDDTDTIRMDSSNNVEVPNGDLDVSNGGITTNNRIKISGSNPPMFVADSTDTSAARRVFSMEEQGTEQWAIIHNVAGSDEFTITDRSSGSTDVIEAELGGNVQIPNGNLDVSNQLSVGSTECNAGEYIDGDGTCTNVTESTSDVYVKEAGDTMRGDLDMNGNKLQNIGSGNIDVDPNGAGNINMRNEEIQNADIMQSEDMIVGSYSTGTSKVDGNDLYVQDDVEVGGDIVGSGADVAEKIENDSKMDPGTVVEISGNMSVGKTEKARDTEVAGVVSSDPAMVMAKNRDGVPVAMTGTVPVKVTMENGPITPGEMITTSSTPGKAMKCSDMDRCEGSIIGKAMEPADEAGKIQMLVSMG